METPKLLIGLTWGYTLLAKTIQKFEWVYERFGKNTKAPKIPNHAFVKYYENGNWWVQEAEAKGITKPQKWEESEYFGKDNYCFKKPKTDLTDAQLTAAIAYAKSKIDEPYNYMGLFEWVIKAISNKWVGKTGSSAQSSEYCSQFAEDTLNAAIPGLFPHPWEDCPANIYDNEDVLEFYIE
jgi:hypothetical protein